MKCDLLVWKEFLEDFNGISYIPEIKWSSNYDLEFYTDSAGGSINGCAAFFARKWVFMQWTAAWKTPLFSGILLI